MGKNIMSTQEVELMELEDTYSELLMYLTTPNTPTRVEKLERLKELYRQIRILRLEIEQEGDDR